MTGLYARTSGAVGLAHMGWPLSEEVPTIVDYLNNAGYETIHSGMEHERHPGQNHYQVELQKHWVHFNTHRAVDEALSYLSRRNRSRPFYLNIGSQQPHASTWDKAEALYGGPVPPEDVYVPLYLPDWPSVRRQLGLFQAAIRYVDEHFGRLLRGLKELGYDEDTIVIFTTDHGIGAPRSKGTLYDRGVEVALIVRLPDRRLAGTAIGHLIQNIDLVPTLLEAAQAPIPERLQGRSFWPLLAGGEYVPHQHIFIERNFHGEPRVHGARKDYVDRYDPVRAVRTPEFHYIKNLDPTVKCRPWLPFELQECEPTGADAFGMPAPREPRPEEELYHVAVDPLEFVNVAQRPEYRHGRAALESKLREWMEQTGDFALTGDVPRRPERPNWGRFEGMPGDEEQARREGWFQ